MSNDEFPNNEIVHTSDNGFAVDHPDFIGTLIHLSGSIITHKNILIHNPYGYAYIATVNSSFCLENREIFRFSKNMQNPSDIKYRLDQLRNHKNYRTHNG